MNNDCQACGGALKIKYKINARNLTILLLYLLALFFSFIVLIRFSGWYGAIIVTAFAIALGYAIRKSFARYTQCEKCHTTNDL